MLFVRRKMLLTRNFTSFNKECNLHFQGEYIVQDCILSMVSNRLTLNLSPASSDCHLVFKYAVESCISTWTLSIIELEIYR